MFHKELYLYAGYYRSKYSKLFFTIMSELKTCFKRVDDGDKIICLLKCGTTVCVRTMEIVGEMEGEK